MAHSQDYILFYSQIESDMNKLTIILLFDLNVILFGIKSIAKICLQSNIWFNLTIFRNRFCLALFLGGEYSKTHVV